MKNRKVVLTARPDGQLKESDMRIVVEEVAELGDGMVLLQIEHLSIDAFIRTTFDEAAFHGTAESQPRRHKVQSQQGAPRTRHLESPVAKRKPVLPPRSVSEASATDV